MSGERVSGIEGDRGADIPGVSGVGNTFEQGRDSSDSDVNGDGLMTLRGDDTEPKVSVAGTTGSAAKASKLRPGEPVNWDAVRLEPGEAVPVSEALSPREFITRLEYIAGLKAHIQHRFEQLALDAGHIKESIADNSMDLNAGLMPQTLFDMELRTLGILKEELPSTLAEKGVVEGDKYIDRLNMYLLNKRYMVTTFENLTSDSLVALGDSGQAILDDAIAFNKAVAGKMFKHLYGIVPDVELMYSESELGIVFMCETDFSVGRLWDKVNRAPVESNYCIGGFQGNANARDPVNEDVSSHSVLPVSTIVLATNAPLNSLTLKVSRGVYLHENQHLVDCALLSEADSIRMTHLYSRDAKGSRMPEYISYDYLELLKTEVYAFDKSIGYDAYTVLTDSAGPYNYNGVLDGPHAGEYKSLVRDATVALKWLIYQYESAYPNNLDYAHKLAIGMLDAFPVYDWLQVAKAARQYSSHQEYMDITFKELSGTTDSKSIASVTTP